MITVHGDQFDNAMKNDFLKWWGEALDPGYDAAVRFDRAFHTKTAKWLKKKAKRAVGDFETASYERIDGKRIDGMICGHTHDAKMIERGGKLLLNSGDWVESCTALTHNKHGQWGILDWFSLREDLGLTTPPSEEDDNPNAAYRPITERQLRWIQRIWPAKNFDKKFKKLQTLKHKMYEDGSDESRKAYVQKKAALRLY